MKCHSLILGFLVFATVFFPGTGISYAGNDARKLYKEFQSTEKLLKSCEAALEDEETFYESFCAAYIAGYIGGKMITSYKIGAELKGEYTDSEHYSELEYCADVIDSKYKNPFMIAQYFVFVFQQGRPEFVRSTLKQEAFTTLENIFFDKRYCAQTKNLGDTNGND